MVVFLPPFKKKKQAKKKRQESFISLMIKVHFCNLEKKE